MVEFRRLATDVYVFLQPALVWYSSAGVIVGDRDVIVIDSLTNAAMAERLRAEIRRVTDKPIRFLVNTHSHADHVFTNHLFPEAAVVSSHKAREATRANQAVQQEADAFLAELFADVDLRGGRYTPQDMTFSGSLTFHQGAREVRVIELGPGHSESDVVVHLPAERILFCGDLFMHGMAPLPGEGHVSGTIANYKAVEAIDADVYVAGHGEPGSLADVRAQRMQLEAQVQHARECYARGIGYDATLRACASDDLPYQRLILLSTYVELTGRRPETSDPDSRNHMTILRGIADEAKRRLDRCHPA